MVTSLLEFGGFRKTKELFLVCSKSPDVQYFFELPSFWEGDGLGEGLTDPGTPNPTSDGWLMSSLFRTVGRCRGRFRDRGNSVVVVLPLFFNKDKI